MIRYSVSLKTLRAKVKAKSPNWLTEAKKRTGVFKAGQKYSEPPKPTWSAIKTVYMEIQFNKCAYCEEKLVGGVRGPITHDVEHYRPKSSVVEWPTRKMLREKRFASYTFQTGGGGGGYYLLPYHLLNYATACKICNSILKRDRFPVSGKRVTDSAAPNRLRGEEPFLLYPLGNVDGADPEQLITFQGYLPIANPKLTDPKQVLRAKVTIDFFELDLREPLIKRRSEIIKAMFESYRDTMIHPDAQRKVQAAKDLQRMQLQSSPHTNCARKFYELCVSDPTTASKFYQEAVNYIEKHPEL